MDARYPNKIKTYSTVRMEAAPIQKQKDTVMDQIFKVNIV